MVTKKKKKSRGDRLGFGDEHTHTLCIKQINNKDLLQSTENTIQCLVITYNGKESEKRTYIYN